MSKGSRVADGCQDKREEATSGAREQPPTVPRIQDSVKRPGGGSR